MVTIVLKTLLLVLRWAETTWPQHVDFVSAELTFAYTAAI